MSNVSKCFSCVRKKDYDPKFGYYGCNLSGQECKDYSMFEPKVKPKPITNYDLLIRKTPEELAEFIANAVDCCNCKHPRNGCSENDETCAACWLDWLKEEASE